MERLNEFELEILENLPVEPIGLSLAELADGLLGNRGPAGRGKVKAALDRIASALGGLYVGQDNDRFGACKTQMYGVRKTDMPRVRKSFAKKDSCNRPSVR